MERKHVYQMIDKEREYQNSKSKREIESDEHHSIADWIVYMDYQLNEAKKLIYQLDNSSALESVRKVTALGVACMEHNETLPRKG